MTLCSLLKSNEKCYWIINNTFGLMDTISKEIRHIWFNDVKIKGKNSQGIERILSLSILGLRLKMSYQNQQVVD